LQTVVSIIISLLQLIVTNMLTSDNGSAMQHVHVLKPEQDQLSCHVFANFTPAVSMLFTR